MLHIPVLRIRKWVKPNFTQQGCEITARVIIKIKERHYHDSFATFLNIRLDKIFGIAFQNIVNLIE